MGWPPAVVIVVRHGARLDAADKQWHLTSPTPYDPPLTYGGWTQSRALGARIASILRSRETDDEVLGDGQNGVARKRRHKVVIHTSPFLRCVQTSIAISAGLAQNPGHTHHHHKPPTSPLVKATQIQSSPRMRPTLATASPSLAPIPEPVVSRLNGKFNEQPDNIKKATLRVDAFLGEWLSPDYFEHITPPPSSVMMVAGAKADLLRKEDYSSLSHVREPATASVGFPGGWGSPVVVAEKKEDDGALSTLSTLGQSLPRRDRTSSLSSVGSSGSRQSHRSTTNLPTAAEHGVYQPPIPAYAISGSDPIPAGYTAHARDACVDVDYQWDSMREPQNWGNGGEYGEEWSSMHKRFRKGLQQLVGWYSNIDDPSKLLTKSGNTSHLRPNTEDSSEDEDTDLVIILVTHGAGCNALIGALTNQPVLLDVGMASLTMAVRKPTPANSPATTPAHSRASSRTVLISDQYDVKLVANTEHLRSTSSTPSTSRSPSLAGLPAFRESFRERYISNSGSLDGSTFARNRPVPTSGNFGSIRRTASIAGSGPRSYTPVRQTSIGLWSAPQPEEEAAEEEPEDDMILNFGDDSGAVKPAEKDEAISVEEEIEVEKDDDDVAPLGGLWGSPRPPGYAEKIREIAPKRRWTVSERG
ncbi:hypothetical protein BKA64DRAFT_157247 [Cadophora sp. MPI-SDFR-AT-0126]|nr:hypothetical protein BKA64DRAFT_157247 [Leotiomycetes sp. MPI-SDFR-AT-0126]